MSVGRFLQQAAAGNAGEGVYVDDLFSTYLYTGNASATKHITNGIDLSGEGGLVWIKNRDQTDDHVLVDTERGVKLIMKTNTTTVSTSDTNTVKTFNSDGFTISNDNKVNSLNEDYCSWTFRKQEKFFDIVTYTGDGVAGRTVSHNLGATPGMMIIKCTSNTADWAVYHRSLGATKYVRLNITNAEASSSAYFNNTDPTSTEFTVGTQSNTNVSGRSYIAYLFAHDEQSFGKNQDEAISACGSYTGNGSATGPSVDLGFEPQWLLIKKVDSSRNWIILDIMRGQSWDNTGQKLEANVNGSEVNRAAIKPTATGFDLQSSNNDVNGSAGSYIYLAIGRSNKPASEFETTDLFSVLENQPVSTIFGHQHFVDFSFYKWQNGAQSFGVQNRKAGGGDLAFNSTAAESALIGGNVWDRMIGYKNNGPGAGVYTSWAFRRTRNFFDVVIYKGNATARTLNHNLGVAPEMMWIKTLNSAQHWAIYNSTSGATKYMHFNTSAPATGSSYFNDTEPTSSVFSVGTQARTNENGRNIVAYLFASVDGISKIGSFTKVSGTDYDVDCGFSSGARLVIIKRTDSTSPWYMWNSVRGINAGTEPYFALNTNAAETTNADIIDPLSSGFTATNGLTAGDYIFLAIA
jgi:hypothetical protein